jgi:hypothetical protein
MPRLIISMLGLLLGSTLVSGGSIYKWVDSEGQVHYGDRPGTREAEEITIKTQPSEDSALNPQRISQKKLLEAFAQERIRRQEEVERKRQEAAKLKRKCTLAKDQLRRYETARYLYNIDAQGNRIVLSNAERARKAEELRKAITRWCH